MEKKESEKVKLTANILFSGIGAQERGFRNSGLFDVDVLTTSDIDKEAVVSYAAVHCGLTNEMIEEYPDYPSKEQMAQDLTDINLGYDPKQNKPYDWFKLTRRKTKAIERYWLASKLSNNLGDINKIKELPYADLWTCSFPCTDVSIAGNMKGLSPDSGTRSSLLWENIRLLKQAVESDKSPKYIMFENVKNLVGKKFINDFNSLIEVLSELGFNTYWSVINGKDCGIPQKRERVFAFTIRKDIDTGKMDFPKPFDNGLRLKDMLEAQVDEKYYISDEATERFLTNLNSDVINNASAQVGIDKSTKNTSVIEYANCLTAREDRGISHRQAEGTAVIEQIGQLYGTEREPNPLAGRIFSEDCLSPTLRTCSGGSCMPQILQTDNIRIRIRKLTPKECWRLMGFNDADVDNAKAVGVSDSKLYSQAGNSIITNCVELLAEHLYKAQYNPDYVCFDENFTQPRVTTVYATP